MAEPTIKDEFLRYAENIAEAQLVQTCPRRCEGPQADVVNGDRWVKHPEEYLCCSYCGSMHPEVVLNLIEQDCEVVPTDKSYKAYIHFDTHRPYITTKKETTHGSLTTSTGGVQQAKFYFQHFSREQAIKFTEMYNKRIMRVGYPGHFYNRPYFWRPINPEEEQNG